MMFDTLVGGTSDDQVEETEGFEIFRGSKPVCDEILMKTTYFDDYKTEEGVDETKDPILQYLQRYYMGTDHQDFSDVGDLSWDEGDMPHHDIKVWTFNDFMEQYNQLYAYLNTIQVQYHAAKKSSVSCPGLPPGREGRVEALLKDLERDVERRERFLRECGRMVGAFPELEEEVGWRVEHVIAKWDMLGQLRVKCRDKESEVPDIYSDIELEVRCLRRWLREMEARIDPLQCSSILQWSAGDRERKMAEYQVLQTDIESHGRIVKLVLGLCEDLSQDPGLYDLQHAVRVARGLEKRWHHIWLRSLEWQCLLEQWIQDPHTDEITQGEVFDTDDEPLSKIPRMTSDLESCLASPAASLLRRKKRKRWPGVARDGEGEATTRSHLETVLLPNLREKLASSPRLRHRLEAGREGGRGECEVLRGGLGELDWGSADMTDGGGGHTQRTDTPETLDIPATSDTPDTPETPDTQDTSDTPGTPDTPVNTLDILENIIKMQDDEDKSSDGFWDTSDDEAFEENKNVLVQKVRKVTVIHAKQFAKMTGITSDEEEDQMEVRRKYSEEQFSQDSLEPTRDKEREGGTAVYWLQEGSSLDGVSSSCLSSSEVTDKESTGSLSVPPPTERETTLAALLDFGDDYRKYIHSLSDSSSSQKRSRGSKRVKKRSTTRRREGLHNCPYESQSEAELEEACVALSSSQAEMAELEKAATALLAQTGQTTEGKHYVDILTRCSHNVTLLFQLMETVTRGDSFAKQKKCRDIRLLIARWERLLQTVSETVHNASVYSELKDKIESLRCGLTGMGGDRKGEEEEELDIRLQAIKAEHCCLADQKASLLALSLAVQGFIAELASSSQPDTQHIAMGQALRLEVGELYSLWDLCHHEASGAQARVEAGLQQLSQVQAELGELRAEVTAQSGVLRSKAKNKVEQSSEDSGWASEDCNIPGKQERLGRIRQMARNLEAVLSPRSPSVQAMTRTLEATDKELSALQRTYLSLKSRRKKRSGRGVTSNLGVKQDRERFRPRHGVGHMGSGARRKKVAKYSLGVHVVLLLLLFLSWLCQPSCCEGFSAISPFSPQLKYVNGPPPI